MIPQQACNLGKVILVFIDAWQEILDTLHRKYPGCIPPALTDEHASFANCLCEFEGLISRYGSDPEVQQIIARRFRECEKIIQVIPAAAEQKYDFFSHLDEGSRVILSALYEYRHATLDTLSAISGFTHNEVLHRLREVIIPLSIKRWGRPVAVFRESELDLSTGDPITFSWWLNNEVLRETNAVEVAETGDAFVITLDRPGCDLPKNLRVTATCAHGILEITVDKKKGRKKL